MNNQLYNYIFGSLVGLLSKDQIGPTTKDIIDQTQGLTSIYDIERICKGILFPLVDETKESQAVRISKDLSRFLIERLRG